MCDYRYFRDADGMGTYTFRVPRDNDYIATIENRLIELTPGEYAALRYVPIRRLMSVPHFNVVGYPPNEAPVYFNVLSCEVAWLLGLDYNWHFAKAKQ